MRTLFIKLAFAVLFFVVIMSNFSCEKYVKDGEMEGGVALTFDDNYIDDWYRYLPVLDSFGAKVTFYVSHYPMLTPQQKVKLKILHAHGNEIAFHTTHHANLPHLLKNKTLREVMKTEVLDGLDSMAKDGFYPKNFAYPYGQHNDMLDAAMLSIFRSVRLLNGSKDYTKSVCKGKGKCYLRSLSVDDSGVSNDVIDKMLTNASEHNNCVVFMAHKINNPPALQVSVPRLIFLLSKAKQLGLRFYTVQELAR